MEVVPLALELSGGVDLVRHDPGDGLLDVLHPLQHLGVTHVVDILDEVVVLLPESHLGCFLVSLVLEQTIDWLSLIWVPH